MACSDTASCSDLLLTWQLLFRLASVRLECLEVVWCQEQPCIFKVTLVVSCLRSDPDVEVRNPRVRLQLPGVLDPGIGGICLSERNC